MRWLRAWTKGIGASSSFANDSPSTVSATTAAVFVNLEARIYGKEAGICLSFQGFAHKVQTSHQNFSYIYI